MRQVDFIGKRNTWFLISALLILVGLVSMAIPGRGLKLGIDFTGGVLMDLRFAAPVTTTEVQDVLTSVGLSGSQVQKSDLENEALIRTKSLTAEQTKTLNAALEAKFGKFETLRVEDVKAVVGSELTRKGLLALLLANIGMVIYVTVRFEYKFALTAVAAITHDILIVLSAYSILGLEANSPLIAAVLTIVGYSINDTIVVFDRIRERLKSRTKESLGDLVNRSINQTMTRSLNTSLTTMLAILAVLLFGGRTTRDFAIALMVGVTAGTYSSIFVASPLWYLWKLKEERETHRAAQAPQPVRPAVGSSARPAASGQVAAVVGGNKSTGGRKSDRKSTRLNSSH